MNSLITFLMEEDEVQDALIAYRTDPTCTNKQRILETILDCAKNSRNTKRVVLIPIPKKTEKYPQSSSPCRTSPDDIRMRHFAALSRNAARHVRTIGGRPFFVQFDPEEVLSYQESHSLKDLLCAMNGLSLRHEPDLNRMAEILEPFILKLGNITDAGYAKQLLSQMYVVASGKKDPSILASVYAMIVDASEGSMNIANMLNEGK